MLEPINKMVDAAGRLLYAAGDWIRVRGIDLQRLTFADSLDLFNDPRDAGGWLCDDCGVDTRPWEMYVVRDEIWTVAGDAIILCVGCLEERLGRELEPEDFPALPLNDDNELDSVRLRVRKGSGRCSEQLYRLGAAAVMGLGRDQQEVAARLRLEPSMLSVWVTNARIGAEFEAEDGLQSITGGA